MAISEMSDGMGSTYSAPASVPSVAANDLSTSQDNQRILPRQVSTGALRGTQNVGYGDVQIDGSNDRITVGSVTNSLGESAQTILGVLAADSPSDQSFGLKIIDPQGGQLLIGILPDGNLGIQLLDASGNEVMRAGLLPLAQIYGWAAATPGNSLEGQV